MIRIYHNPRCRKSRAGLGFLKTHNLPCEVVDYMKSPLSPETLRALIHKSGLKAEDLVRKQEDLYKKELKGKQLNEEAWISLLLQHPQLLKRPLVQHGNKVIWADPPEEINKIL
jgi:arsenate reductase (glutaredoxin)